MGIYPRLTDTAAKSFVAAMLCALAVSGQAQTWLTNGLVAYYPFSGNANDATGHGYDGEVHGAQLVQDRFGNLGSAYAFNGTNTFIVLTNSVPLTDTWTASAWARLGSLNQQGYFFHIGTDTGTAGDITNWFSPYGNGFGPLYINGNLYDVKNPTCFVGVTPLPADTNAWFQIVVRRSKSAARISVNGTIGCDGWTCTSTIPVQGFIGAGSTNGLFFTGDVDDVRVYDRYLSEAEVQQLFAYESGRWSGLTKPVTPTFPNLIMDSYYQLQFSPDMKTWTNQGFPFPATNSTMTLPQYFDVAKWGALFFRLQK